MHLAKSKTVIGFQKPFKISSFSIYRWAKCPWPVGKSLKKSNFYLLGVSIRIVLLYSICLIQTLCCSMRLSFTFIICLMLGFMFLRINTEFSVFTAAIVRWNLFPYDIEITYEQKRILFHIPSHRNSRLFKSGSLVGQDIQPLLPVQHCRSLVFKYLCASIAHYWIAPSIWKIGDPGRYNILGVA